jgi:hypothetical protein
MAGDGVACLLAIALPFRGQSRYFMNVVYLSGPDYLSHCLQPPGREVGSHTSI